MQGAENYLPLFYVGENCMLRFYDVDLHYVQWLKSIDQQIPDIQYSNNNKFVCGVVLDINGVNYYAPISSNTRVYRTSLPIYDTTSIPHRIISTIRFSFMFPASSSVLTELDFSKIRTLNPQYASLLQKEWEYCKNNESAIHNKAMQVYRIGCNSNHVLNYTCCKFDILEKRFTEWSRSSKID